MDAWKSTDVAAGLHGRPPVETHHTAPPPGAQGSVFMFQRRRVPINWRHLAGLDVDRVCREMDVQALQQNITNVTFCNIESEEFHGVDSNFIKLFRLAQLTIEYLLHSQQYLSDQRTQCEQHIQQLQKELEVCRSEASARAEEVKTVKKENRKRRKIIEAYQDMLSQGATGLHPCPVCSKEFVSKQYLDSHVQRRHPNHLQNMTATADDRQALSQEEIERRLMEQMNEKFQITEQLLRQELARKEGESLQSQAREFEQWKQMQQEKRKVEMEEVQAPLREKLRTLEQEKEQLHREFQEKQAEVVAMKRHSHTQESDCAGEVKGHEMVDSSTATDMKHLETKVASKWKKHKKDIHKHMQQMNKSYQDQLVEISEKLASMEQIKLSREQTSPDGEREQKKQEEGMKKELHALQQKVIEQEQMLSSQKQQLSTLQSQEPSLALSATSSHNAKKVVPVEDESEVSESTEEVDGGEEGEGEESDYPDTPQFTPFPNRNTISTLFNHEQVAMEKIHRETVSILDNALLQRGVTKGTVGMSDAQLDSKMKLLVAERQQRIQMHSQFVEHRQRLAEEVESSAAANCQFHPPQDLLPSPPPLTSPSTSPRRATPPRRTTPPQKTTHPQRTTPPQRTSPHRQQKTSPSRSQHPSTSGRVSSKPPTGLPPAPQSGGPSQGAHRDAHTVRQQQIHVGDSDSETGTETDSESDSESYAEDDQPPIAPEKRVPDGGVRVLPASSGQWNLGSGERRSGGSAGGKDREGEGHAGEGERDDVSPWDSEDSTDHLTTQDLMSVPSSTPVQVLTVKSAKTLSNNSWDDTETSGSSTHFKRNAPSSGERHPQQTATHSAGNSLTTVTHGEFEDSDPSDLSTTQLI